MMKLKLTLLSVFLSSSCFADKFALGGGYYSISASVGERETSLASAGVLSFRYSKTFMSLFSLNVDYSVLSESLFSGDKSYGPQISLSYFHYGAETANNIVTDGFSLSSLKKLNPYGIVGFSQREYQSIESSYSGFFLGGGVEMGFKNNFGFYTELKYSMLGGPNSGEVNETLLGVGGFLNF